MVDRSNPLYQSDLESTFSYLQKWIEEEKKKILIVGATGLIGSFLVDACILFNEKHEEKLEIYAMGRSRERLEVRFGYKTSQQLHLVEQDVHEKLEPVCEYDVIFHLASNADPGAYEEYPYETITTNVQGAMNVIGYAKKHPRTEVLFTSTMEVYGEIQKESLEEDMYGAIDYNQLRAGYPESKRVSELLYRSAVKEYGICAKIARMGYIYGPTMTESDNKIIAEFIRKKTKHESMELKSAGTQRRAYCYVADAVTGMLTVLQKGEAGQAYNVADENSIVSIRELAKLFDAEMNETLEERSQIFDTVLNTKRLQALGWKAIIHLKEGVDRSVQCMTRGME